MADIVTKNDIAEVRKDIEEVLTVLQDFMRQADERFERIKRHIKQLNNSHNRLLNAIDGFIGRLDHYEAEQAARDSQFEKVGSLGTQSIREDRYTTGKSLDFMVKIK